MASKEASAREHGGDFRDLEKRTRRFFRLPRCPPSALVSNFQNLADPPDGRGVRARVRRDRVRIERGDQQPRAPDACARRPRRCTVLPRRLPSPRASGTNRRSCTTTANPARSSSHSAARTSPRPHPAPRKIISCTTSVSGRARACALLFRPRQRRREFFCPALANVSAALRLRGRCRRDVTLLRQRRPGRLRADRIRVHACVIVAALGRQFLRLRCVFLPWWRARPPRATRTTRPRLRPRAAQMNGSRSWNDIHGRDSSSGCVAADQDAVGALPDSSFYVAPSSTSSAAATSRSREPRRYPRCTSCTSSPSPPLPGSRRDFARARANPRRRGRGARATGRLAGEEERSAPPRRRSRRAAIAATAVTAATAAKTAPRVSALSRRRRDSPAGFRRGDGARAAPGGCVDCADACAWGTRETIRAAFTGARAPTLAVLRATMPELGKHAPRGFVARASHAALPVAAPVFFVVSTGIAPGSCQSWAPSSARCAARPGPPRRTRRGPRVRPARRPRDEEDRDGGAHRGGVRASHRLDGRHRVRARRALLLRRANQRTERVRARGDRVRVGDQRRRSASDAAGAGDRPWPSRRVSAGRCLTSSSAPPGWWRRRRRAGRCGVFDSKTRSSCSPRVR